MRHTRTSGTSYCKGDEKNRVLAALSTVNQIRNSQRCSLRVAARTAAATSQPLFTPVHFPSIIYSMYNQATAQEV